MTHPSIHAKAHPDKIAYLMAESGAALTYRQLDERSNQGAHLFRSLGLQAGDHIAFLLENTLTFLEICWAAQRAGLYFTAISRYLTAGETAYIVKDCGARVFIASPSCREGARGVDDLPGVTRFMLGASSEAPAGYASWDDAVSKQPTTPIADETRGFDMLYSSGTTGQPKGVLKAFVREPIETLTPLLNVLVGEQLGLNQTTTYLSPAPLYHAAPLRFNMMAASLGGTSIIMEKFDPERYLELVEKHRVTHSQVVPTMFVRILKLPEEVRKRYDLSSLKGVVHAAAPCPVDVKAQMIDWWGPILLEYYAGTESNGMTVCTSPEWLAHRGTVGRTVFGSIEIVGEDGAVLPVGEIGAVYFVGGPAFSYHNDPVKTASAFNVRGGSTLGDIGYLDKDGFLYLTDRKAYMIISGGVNIYPQEAENVLINHPKVGDVAVFGIPNPEMGEEVKAVVQPRDMKDAGPELEAELIGYCRTHLSKVKCPRTIDFSPELPRTPTGKLVKRHLRDAYWKNTPGTARIA